VLAALIDLVLPRSCLGCAGPVGPMCPACWPKDPVLHMGDTWAAASYDGTVRTALLSYKERGRRDLAAPLAALLARAVRAGPGAQSCAAARSAVLVPIPSARPAAAARGGDHVLRLARKAAPACGLRIAGHALTQTRPVRDSAGLTTPERAANLAGALAARTAPPGLAAILVDDIVTTGATLREARRALEHAGWPVLGAAVVAATPRRYAGSMALHWQSTGTRSSVVTT